MTSPPVLEGIRIIEVAQFVFVPVASGVLAEWGADVIKVEPPIGGDAYRGLRRTGNLPTSGVVNYAWQHANRGKRSIGLDLTQDEGRKILDTLLADADVLLTNLLPASRERLGLSLERVQKDHPQLIFARGTALGERGPERERGGYDHATYWARSGAQYGATPAEADRPSPMPGGAFGDSTAGLALAGGISAALLYRERTGVATSVDLSLLGLGMWSMASAITGALQQGVAAAPMARVPAFNPLAGQYRTQDGRWITLGLLQGHAQWPLLCRALGHSEWIDDPRFSETSAFEANLPIVQALLDDEFAARPLAHWREAMADLDAVWEVSQDTLEASRDRQALANGYIAPVELDLAAKVDPDTDNAFHLVSNPVQFGEAAGAPRRAPEAFEHTEEILLAHGIDWDEITRLKQAGTIN